MQQKKQNEIVGRVTVRVGEQFAYAPLPVAGGLPVGVRPEATVMDVHGLVKQVRDALGGQVIAVRG